MRRIISAILLFPLAIACAKIENTYVPEKQEIAFQTLGNLPTKATTAFSEEKKFVSYAYYLPYDKVWAESKDEAIIWINGEVVSNVASTTKWKTSETHYWPGAGRLSFFAWTDYTSSPSLSGAASLTCTPSGIQITSYNITENKGKDLMVADPELSLISSTYENGVPTLFHRIQCGFEFKVQVGNTDEDKNIEYKVTNIDFTNIYTSGDYTEGGTPSEWDNHNNEENIPLYTGGSGGQTVTSTPTPLNPSDSDYNVLIPQKTQYTDRDPEDQPQLKITYTITINGGTPIEVTRYIPLKELYEVSEFDPGKLYELNITIGRSEVSWTPNVTDWEVFERTEYIK